ncbi:MAG: glycosyltransferase family 4 protein, partial [Myxococcales bacterium]|nr:glycosyltransferase family 4 protein [Myxococcales bacterium]
MRVLAITKIFPNAAEPLSAPFNRQQFAALGRLCDVEVLASIPWFPGAGAFGKWSA